MLSDFLLLVFREFFDSSLFNMSSGKYVKARAEMKRFTIFINCELFKLLVNYIRLLRDYLRKVI